jgi:hypothetical protein
MCSLPGFSGRFCSYRKPNFPAVSGSYLPGFSSRICSYWQPNFPAVLGSYLPGFSGRICSYWQPNFPAVSVVTCRDFLALPFLAPEGRDFPAVSVVSGRDFLAVAFLAWVIKKNSMGSRQIVLVSTAGFSVLNTGIFWREAKTKRLFSHTERKGAYRTGAAVLNDPCNGRLFFSH